MTVYSVDAEYLLTTYFKVSKVMYVKEQHHEDGSWTLLVVIQCHTETEYIYTLFHYNGPRAEPEREDYEQIKQIVSQRLYIFLQDEITKNVLDAFK